MDMDYSDILEEDDLSSEEEEELLPEDWDDIALDEELADMAIENLSLSQLHESDDVSVGDATEVPVSALNAVMNMSFNSVLPVDWVRTSYFSDIVFTKALPGRVGVLDCMSEF